MTRQPGIDALRGMAMLAMLAYHAAFDLQHFGWLHANPYADARWISARCVILSSFLLCLGLSLAQRRWQEPTAWQRFAWRWAQIAAAALLVSLGSYLVFPNSFISFGVLHGMALMLPILLLTRGLGRGQWWLALLAVLLWLSWRHPLFDSRWSNWVGLVTHKPITEDYVPLLPWIAVAWAGAALGQVRTNGTPAAAVLALNRLPSPAWLLQLSRWPLSFYLLHQPVLFGLLWLAGLWLRPT